MKNILKSIAVLLISIAFVSCSKEIPTQMTGYFYTTDMPTNEKPFRLVLDGVDKGVIPSMDFDMNKLTSLDSDFKSKTLRLDFMSGKHFVELKDDKGNTISATSFNFEFYKHKNKSELGSKNETGSFGAASMRGFDAQKDEVGFLIATTLKYE